MSRLLKLAERLQDRFARMIRSKIRSFYLLRNPEAAAAIAAADIFDKDWYLSQNPDVASAGVGAFTHYLTRGAVEGRIPGPKFNINEYRYQNPKLKADGVDPVVHFISTPQQIDAIVRRRFLAGQPLRFYRVPGEQVRINLVVDCLNADRLVQGLSAAVIFVGLYAKKTGASLRLIARSDDVDEIGLRQLLHSADIADYKAIEIVHAKLDDSGSELNLFASDIFITTSWLTTQSVHSTVAANKIIYFILEDERPHYPMGEDYLRCGETLRSSDIKFVVSTKSLYDHLVSSGYKNISDHGNWFEPAFPRQAFFRQARDATNKKNFLFYGSPHDPRQLYYRGLEVIEKAVQLGLFDESEWQFHFAYKNIPPITVGQDWRPEFVEIKSWEDYCSLLRKTDLALCLAYSPHPSIQAFDLAACGAVVVTNRFGTMSKLDTVSNNIICSDTDVDSLVTALSAGARMAASEEVRQINCEQSNLSRDWSSAYSAVLAQLMKE